MNRAAHALLALAASTIVVTGCTVAPLPTPSSSSAMKQMPEVTVTGPVNELEPLTDAELGEMRDGPVSAAVNTLVLRGYHPVHVVDGDGYTLRQHQWDTRSVIEVSLDEGTALLIVE